MQPVNFLPHLWAQDPSPEQILPHPHVPPEAMPVSLYFTYLLGAALYHSILSTFWGKLSFLDCVLPLALFLFALLQPRPPGILALPSKKYNLPHSLSYVSRASRGPHSHALFPGDPSSGLTHGPECDSQKDPDLCCPI